MEKFKLKHRQIFPIKAKPHFFCTGKLLTKKELMMVNIPTKSAADSTITVRIIKMNKEAIQLHFMMSSIFKAKRKNWPKIKILPKIKLLFFR